MQKVITITIDGLPKPASDNPFTAIGNEIKRKDALKSSIREANFQIRAELENELEELQSYLIGRLEEAGVPADKMTGTLSKGSYDNAREVLVKNIRFSSRKEIIFKIHAELMEAEGHDMYTGAYTMCYALCSVHKWEVRPSSVKWVEFNTTEKIEQAIVKLLQLS